MIWDDNEWPLAYLITFRTYGTWLHGDERTSVDLRGQNAYGTRRVAPNGNLSKLMEKNMAESSFLLEDRQRPLVESAIREVCIYRSYSLIATTCEQTTCTL